jgi:hypothetical protein
MERRIIGYHQDIDHQWIAELECGHFQHVRHNPPWTNRPWVMTVEGRNAMIGFKLKCKECDAGTAKN